MHVCMNAPMLACATLQHVHILGARLVSPEQHDYVLAWKRIMRPCLPEHSSWAFVDALVQRHPTHTIFGRACGGRYLQLSGLASCGPKGVAALRKSWPTTCPKSTLCWRRHRPNQRCQYLVQGCANAREHLRGIPRSRMPLRQLAVPLRTCMLCLTRARVPKRVSSRQDIRHGTLA